MLSRTCFRRPVVPEIFLLRMALSIAFILRSSARGPAHLGPHDISAPAPTYRDTADILKMPTSGGERIAAVYLPNPARRTPVLFSHGNAEDLGWVLPSLPPLRDLGFGVFAYDYRGYGLSQGRASEQHVYADIDAAYDYLTRELRVPAARIILYGRSLGAGAAVDLAARQSVGGLIVESPFLTAFRVMTRIPLFPFDRFRNVDKIGRVRCPVLVMHGEADEIVPLWHGQQLFRAGARAQDVPRGPRRPSQRLPVVAGARYVTALRDFEALLREH